MFIDTPPRASTICLIIRKSRLKRAEIEIRDMYGTNLALFSSVKIYDLSNQATNLHFLWVITLDRKVAWCMQYRFEFFEFLLINVNGKVGLKLS